VISQSACRRRDWPEMFDAAARRELASSIDQPIAALDHFRRTTRAV
jgi:hypothetical protein